MNRTVKRMSLALLTAFSLSGMVMAQDEPYRDPTLPIEERVEDLLSRMTLEEKFGQMTQVEKNSLTPEIVTELFIGSVLSGGGGNPTPNNAENWAAMVAEFQDAALATRLGIPLIYGVDAVHGHNNLAGAVIFPHNIGLGATRNPELVEQIGQITAIEMLATGAYWDFAPVVAVPQDIRWGRAYEGYAENTEVVTMLGTAFLIGLQEPNLADPMSVLATAKHFVGDGGAEWGTSPFGPSNIDRGMMGVDEETLRAVHLPPYQAAIDAGAMSVMASFSGWDELNMHEQSYLLNDVLKGELGFQGFVVSDWAGIDAVAPNYYDAVVTSINAGVDMNMVPTDYGRFLDVMAEAVENGDIPVERVDEAVRRILRVKFALGLFERPNSLPQLLETVGSEEHRAVAQQAVSESLVLLKNSNEALPLTEDIGTILVGGEAADNLGYQSGGWTIEWQGTTSNATEGTTFLEALEAAAPENTDIQYNRFARFDALAEAGTVSDVGIVVVAEPPYAEFEGDSETLALSERDMSVVERMRPLVNKLIVIVYSGRPVIINDLIHQSDAIVAAWLPGTEGAGITDVLYGDLPFTGRLSFTWPRTIDQIPFDFSNLATEGCEAPLFPYDYGLTTDASDSEWVELALECAPVPEVAVVPTNAPAAPVDGAAPIAPAGVFGETYVAPFPVAITVDGDLADWAGVPRQTLTSSNDTGAAVSFASAADAENLYLMADVTDMAIVSGEHGADLWNEDSVEFYINLSGDLEATSYGPGIFQLTLPPMNAGKTGADIVIGGVQHESANANVVTVTTDTGYRVEVAVPLAGAIVPEHEAEIGFQVHLNGSVGGDRDTKLIWSIFDSNDSSYQNPSVFGRLEFFEVGTAFENTAAAVSTEPEVTETPLDESITWESREWNLVWADEFDAAAGTPPNSEYWNYDIGGHGWGNNELEYYTDRVENVAHDGEGNLVITATPEGVEDLNCHYGPCEYTSARILTQGKVEFTYGRVEARIRVPYGNGIWPAFWMLGANFGQVGWPGSGEIDIMEIIGREPTMLYNTVHGVGYSGASGIGHGTDYGSPLSDDYHVFAIDWDPDAIRWYLDGELVNTLVPSDTNGRRWAFDHDFFIILNVAVGGNWPGLPDETTTFPQHMLIDYVRVYELAE